MRELCWRRNRKQGRFHGSSGYGVGCGYKTASQKTRLRGVLPWPPRGEAQDLGMVLVLVNLLCLSNSSSDMVFRFCGNVVSKFREWQREALHPMKRQSGSCYPANRQEVTALQHRRLESIRSQ